MLGKNLFQHKGRDGSDAGGGDSLALQILWAADFRARDQPLKHAIISGDDDLERRVTARDADQRARAGAGELHVAAKHGLDARRRRHEDHPLIQAFLLRVPLLLRNRINDHLKTLGRNRHVDDL